MSSISAAISQGDLETVKRLLEQDPTLAQGSAESGETLVQRAAYYRQHEILEVLLAANPTLDLASACAAGCLEVVERIIGSDPNQLSSLSNDGFTPLCLASAFGHHAIASFLLHQGADPNARSRSLGGVAPIHSAVFGRQPEMVELLLKYGADPNEVQSGGFTPLQGAAENGDIETAVLLLQHGAKPNIESSDGKTALDFAIAGNHLELAALIQKFE